MHKAILGLVFLIGIGAYVRHQFHRVIQQATKPQPIFPTKPQESRSKCIICNGTGRAVQLNLGMPQKNSSGGYESCRSCRGMGWVDNPAFRR